MMKTKLLLQSFIACAMTFTSVAQDTDDSYKLLFIGIDGCRSDALQQQITNGNAPNIKSIMDVGLYTFDSWHLGITSSGPSWSDMLTGVWENKHGVTSNNYTGSNYNTYPYFPKRVKECRPNAKAVQITSWSPMSDNVYNDGWNSKIVPPTDDACASVAVTQLADASLDILFVHLDDVDGAGHSNGFNPAVSSYMNAIAYADTKVGQVLQALYARPNYANEKWVILLTTDHGGTGTTHGGNSNDERHIWWTASGYNIPHLQITATDPGSYQFGTPPTLTAVHNTPVLTDIASTAIDHLISDNACITSHEAAWNLDGKSWLDEGNLYVEDNDAAAAFAIYPNPSNGVFDIVYDGQTAETFTVSVIDLNGSVIQSGDMTNYSAYSKQKIDISSLANGTYLLKIQTGNSIVTKRIIKR
jgi:hypothetical protein